MAETGRPSDYSQEACATVLALGTEGKSVVQMACAIGVHRDTLYEWAKVHVEFSDAFTRARLLSQAWWEEFGQSNLLTQGVNAALYNKIISSRFKADYGDKMTLAGDKENPLGGLSEADIDARIKHLMGLDDVPSH